MADRAVNTTTTAMTLAAAATSAPKPIWVKQAEEKKLKSEADKTAAAKAAFEATFREVESSNGDRALTVAGDEDDDDDDEDDDEEERERKRLARKPIGPVDPNKCTASGSGIGGGTAGVASTFVVVTKDSDGRKVPNGGAQVKVIVSPGVGVGGSEQSGIVKDMGDGTYGVTYVVSKRGNYMVNVECNGMPIMGSPFPVFFSTGTATGGLLGVAPPVSYPSMVNQGSYPNMVNQTMPNMPNYSASVSASFTGLLGMIPGIVQGASGGVVLPGIGMTLGEVCREYLNGRCAKTDCKCNHPPHNLLMTALAATTSMNTVSQVPMAPSAAAMAAAQAIIAAKALEAHAAQAQAAQFAKGASGATDREGRLDSLKKTVQVSNLSPLLTVDQLKQLFGFCGNIVECFITDSKHFAYIEYTKFEEATAALALNNVDVGGRPLNVEMAKSLPPKPPMSLASPSLPLMMQQAVAMQQMHFQQALLVQQSFAAQQAANRAANMKNSTELAAARAAEISRTLKPDGAEAEEKEKDAKSGSPSPTRARSRSRSKSRSPISYRPRGRSPSFSPPRRYSRDYRSRYPVRSQRYTSYQSDRRSYVDSLDDSRRNRRDSGRSHGRHSPVSRRNRSRSGSPRSRKARRGDSGSPRRIRDSPARRTRRSSRSVSRSPVHHRRSRSSPRNDEHKSKHRKRSRSRSVERNHRSGDRVSERREERSGDRVSERREERSGNKVSERREERSKRRNRQSRSPSSESKDHKVSESAFKSSDSKLKYSGGSKEKHRLDDKLDRSREEKSKNRDRKRSRSTEDRQHEDSRVSPRYSDERKRKHRKRSRSKSSDRKGRKHDVSGESESENVKEAGGTEDGQHDDSRMSPRYSDERKRKHRKHSRSKSSERKGCKHDVSAESESESESENAKELGGTIKTNDFSEPDVEIKDDGIEREECEQEDEEFIDRNAGKDEATVPEEILS